mgnify:CR=1 FL=1
MLSCIMYIIHVIQIQGTNKFHMSFHLYKWFWMQDKVNILKSVMYFFCFLPHSDEQDEKRFWELLVSCVYNIDT